MDPKTLFVEFVRNSGSQALWEIDWGAQVEVQKDAAGSGLALTLDLIRKKMLS